VRRRRAVLGVETFRRTILMKQQYEGRLYCKIEESIGVTKRRRTSIRGGYEWVNRTERSTIRMRVIIKGTNVRRKIESMRTTRRRTRRSTLVKEDSEKKDDRDKQS